ncbi:DUF2834 domain-containing protein [Pseudochryseolinea flava]|uniref:DUF2834 domain-containing protein n=1 Tax=Pseudochryseolinea flava TaxID=2059302 RepID=A0A364XUV4_9BACT|nr:DUF2834 domain-containing protein [Pseudochryseolinea flava]RAV97740.1 hypothetical protein DQQ10_26965 [Pseudochryseolinea flava]
MRSWTGVMWFYLLMAIAGALLPWYFNIQALLGPVPFTLKNYIAAGFANNFVASISIDFLIAASTMMTWMIIESRRIKMRYIGWYIAFTFLISFAMTCPLFLFNRERLLK